MATAHAQGTRVTVNFKLDRGGLARAKARATHDSVQRACTKVEGYLRQEVVAADRINTGALMDSFRSYPMAMTPDVVTFRVDSPLPYARWQNDGIGPVYPVRAKALRFKPKGSGVYVFAKSTRGFDGAQFYQKALRRVTINDFMV